MDVSCHRPFLPGTSLEPAVILIIIIIIIRYGCLLSQAFSSRYFSWTNGDPYYYYYYYYTIWLSLVTGLFFPVLLLNQRWSPLLTLQAPHCSTFRIMCNVPSIDVFCIESIECFPGTVSKFFLKLLVIIPVAPIITGTIVHFRFHIRYICIIIIIIIIILPTELPGTLSEYVPSLKQFIVKLTIFVNLVISVHSANNTILYVDTIYAFSC